MKLSPAEAITAATFNGACALNLQHKKGSLEPGKDADVAIFNAEDYRELAYWFGVNRCERMYLHGERFEEIRRANRTSWLTRQQSNSNLLDEGCSMPTFEPEDFFAALRRLYDSHSNLTKNCAS